MITPLQKSISLVGSQSALAKALSTEDELVSQQMVNYWVRSDGFLLSPSHCTSIEKLTHGQVTRKDLRPNDWHRIWPELAEPNATSGLES